MHSVTTNISYIHNVKLCLFCVQTKLKQPKHYFYHHYYNKSFNPLRLLDYLILKKKNRYTSTNPQYGCPFIFFITLVSVKQTLKNIIHLLNNKFPQCTFYYDIKKDLESIFSECFIFSHFTHKRLLFIK